MKILRSALLIAMVIFLSFFSVIKVQAVAVQPLVIELEATPGGRHPFEVLLTAEELQETIHLNLYSILQATDGNLQYYEAVDDPISDWISFENSVLIIPPGEERAIRGEIRVPQNAGGTYVLALMVEPQTLYTSDEVTFRVRYAIRFIIHVERPGLRPDIAIEQLGMQLDEGGSLIARTIVTNRSNLLYPMSAEMTIRDENRALVERIVFGWQDMELAEKPTFDIYPGAELWLDGVMKKPLYPGEYDLRLFVNYADGRQKVYSEELLVEDMSFASAAEHGVLHIEPTLLDVEIRPGGADSQILQLTNNSAEPIFVELAGKEIEPEYPRSIFENCTVEMRTSEIMEIAPRRTARAVLVLRAPREDGIGGGYYGYMNATARSNEDEAILDEQDILLRAIVIENIVTEARVNSAVAIPNDEDLLLSVVVENLGNVHIIPVGVAYLKDASGEIIRTIQLTLQDGMGQILPAQSGYMVGEGWTAESGDYTVEIRILDGSLEIASSEENLFVP